MNVPDDGGLLKPDVVEGTDDEDSSVSEVGVVGIVEASELGGGYGGFAGSGLGAYRETDIFHLYSVSNQKRNPFSVSDRISDNVFRDGTCSVSIPFLIQIRDGIFANQKRKIPFLICEFFVVAALCSHSLRLKFLSSSRDSVSDSSRTFVLMKFLLSVKLVEIFSLSRACVALASLRNTEVVSLLAKVVEHLVTGCGMEYYLRKTYYKTTSLISNICKAIAILLGQTAEVSMLAYDYGKNLGIVTAPILFAMEEFPQMRTVVDRGFDDPVQIEADDVPVAISNEMSKSQINMLVIGASSGGSFTRLTEEPVAYGKLGLANLFAVLTDLLMELDSMDEVDDFDTFKERILGSA
ncbi:hypothetical protein Syun_027790 [Stephania yunnanensis]|uniref:Uncharacterized protein n=1 Tax=Stephania yunnanensis TaxID=152371 RepID=A0AAP0HN49_9MAGN